MTHAAITFYFRSGDNERKKPMSDSSEISLIYYHITYKLRRIQGSV